MRRPFLLVPLAGLASLSACGPQVYAPSLAPRPVEKQPVELPAESSAPEASLDPALPPRLAPLVAAAQAGDRAFAHQHEITEPLVAKAAGTEAGNEAWVTAQQALSALDTTRGPVRDAAATIEAIRHEPAHAGAADQNAIDKAAKAIEAIDTAESAMMAALAAKLGR